MIARRWPVPVAVVLLPLVLACGRDTGPVRIGIAGPLTDSVGAPMRRAVELAAEQLNAAGGVGGRPLQLVFGDDGGTPDSAVAVATALVDSGVVAVVGHVYSGATLAAAPVYNDPAHPVVQISPSSSAPEVSQAGAWTFRTCPSDLQQGAALARFVANRLGLVHGTVLYLNDPYGRGIRATFATEFARLGGLIDDQAPYLGEDPEVGPYFERIARRKLSQFVFLAGKRAEAEAILRDARARGVMVPFLGGDGLEGLEETGALAEGTYISGAYLAGFDTPKNRQFVLDYMRKYPNARPPNQAAAAAYDIVHLLRDVIAKVGTDRRRIRDAVAQIGLGAPAYEGVTGEIAFDSLGDVPRQRVIISRVTGGRVVAVEGL